MVELPSLHALALYLATVEHQTMMAAAEQEGISQPAISAQIKALERYFGTSLMERAGRRVRPTEAGELVADYTRRILGLVEELGLAIADLDGLRAGHLTIGASATVGETWLPEVLANFHQSFPGVELSVRIGNSGEILQGVRDRQLGFGVVGRLEPDPEFTTRPVHDDNLVLIAAANHPACQHSSLRLADLAAERFVLREPGSATREIALRCLTAHDFVPVKSMEVGSNDALKRAVAAGLGIGIVSIRTLSLELRLGELCVLDCIGWECRRDFYLVHRTDRLLTKAERAFLRLLELEVRQVPSLNQYD